jgi:outer membrane protein assembly factor BamB
MRPILKGDRLYAGTQSGEKTEFVALDAGTGEMIWRNKEARVYAAERAAGKIFVNTGRDVMALDKETGRTLWHAGLQAGHGESGLAYLDGYVYHPHGQGLRVIDAETGEVVHIEWPENGYFWEVGVGAGKVFAQDSGALYAFEPYSLE